jgi:butyryl-CoA dehydrogenase
VTRKLARDDGAGLGALIVLMRTTAEAAGNGSSGQLGAAIDRLSVATDSLLKCFKRNRMAALAVASSYLTLVGTVAGGWLLTKAAAAARRRQAEAPENAEYLTAKDSIARFYAANLLPQADALARIVVSGADTVLALAEDQF